MDILLYIAHIKAIKLCHSQGIVLLRLEEIYNIRVYMHVSILYTRNKTRLLIQMCSRTIMYMHFCILYYVYTKYTYSFLCVYMQAMAWSCCFICQCSKNHLCWIISCGHPNCKQRLLQLCLCSWLHWPRVLTTVESTRIRRVLPHQLHCEVCLIPQWVHQQEWSCGGEHDCHKPRLISS